MQYKSFLYFSAALTILEAPLPSYAMESGENKIGVPIGVSPAAEPSMEELTNIATKAQKFYVEAQSMKVSLDKATKYGEVINLIQPYRPTFASLSEQSLELKEVSSIITELLADSFQQKGAILHKLGSNVKVPTPQHINYLCEALTCLNESYSFYRKLQPQGKQTQVSLLNYVTAMNNLAMAYIVCAEKEKSPAEKISTYLKSLKAFKDSYQLKPTMGKIEDAQKGLMLALKEGSDVYYNLALHSDIYQEPESMQKYQSIVKNMTLVKDILVLFENYLTDSFVPFEWELVEDNPSHKTSRRGRAKASPSKETKPTTPLLNPEDCVPIILSTYCGMLKRAGDTITQLQTDNPLLMKMYQEKGRVHINLANNIYKEKIYKGEYAHDPEKVDTFILARLEALAGNEEALRVFYRTLTQDYQHRQRQVIVRHIRTEQEERQCQEERERHLAEEIAQRRQAHLNQLKLSKTMSTTTTTDLHEVEYQPEEKYQVIEPRLKPKTHGTPYSPPPVETKQEEAAVINKQIITLDPNSYHVFQSLTGKNYDKNITLKQVLQLLKDLKCTLSLAKGSHNKATAPNSQIWTIPRPWDGPIPGYYHGQLMEFLLHDMGITSEELKV